MKRADLDRELNELLEGVAYELSGVRASALDDPQRSRAALKKARDLLADAETLVSGVVAQEVEPGDA